MRTIAEAGPVEAGRLTDRSTPDPGLRPLFGEDHRWRRWLDVEAALAGAEAELGLIPPEAAAAIVAVARPERLDLVRVRAGVAETSHALMPLVTELARAAGEPAGGYVHWGATTQNITQTGNAMVLRDAQAQLLGLAARVLDAAADLAEREAVTIMAGRTHGQHAVPVTFGFRVAVWTDVFDRQVDRLRHGETALFTAMMGGAAGTFASFGTAGPAVQDGVARRLSLAPVRLPARTATDPLVAHVIALAMLAGTGENIAGGVAALMQTEFGEVAEPAPDASVGSSTMPHKRNPKLCHDVHALGAELRGLVPPALETLSQEHEADGAATAILDGAVTRACVLAGDLLERLAVILEGLHVDRDRMRANLDLTGGLIVSEQVMLGLASAIGRQEAHRVIAGAARRAHDERRSFPNVLATDPEVSAHVTPAELTALLDPAAHTGQAERIAHEAAYRARATAADLRRTLPRPSRRQ